MELSEDRDYLFKVAKSSKDEEDWKQARAARFNANKNIRRAKKQFILSQISAVKETIRNFGQLCPLLFPLKELIPFPQYIYVADGSSLLHGVAAANAINQYFVR